MVWRGDGRSGRVRICGIRPEKSEWICVRHRHRPAGDAEVRNRRYSGVFSERRAVFETVSVKERVPEDRSKRDFSLRKPTDSRERIGKREGWLVPFEMTACVEAR